ncbi:shikimate dehydrogenase [Glaciecola sp. XM2]|uniref:shikimate dehydrogenase n=1 Tax=Glaciecola sp. XM2 TaxID=1914931 RepID=UPI0020330359|nr:shikimate dehydrogenase [Glaciecola sp. XM2]
MKQPSYLACVFGNPIAQSKSPIIHGLFAKQFNIDLEYQKILAGADDFDAAADTFFSNAATIGANVTMPFKHDALAWVDDLSVQAKRAGAVNTIIRTPTGFIGDNSDGVGLVNDLVSHNVVLQGAHVLLIGAGGAAKGALPALIDAGIAHVYLYNRSAVKAKQLADHVNAYSEAMVSIYETSNQTFDVVINATSLSLDNALPDLPDTIFSNKPAVYDMVYQGQQEMHNTAFLKHAKQLGCDIVIDGLGMLVEQAAYSFYLWFDKRPNSQEVLHYLRESG